MPQYESGIPLSEPDPRSPSARNILSPLIEAIVGPHGQPRDPSFDYEGNAALANLRQQFEDAKKKLSEQQQELERIQGNPHASLPNYQKKRVKGAENAIAESEMNIAGLRERLGLRPEPGPPPHEPSSPTGLGPEYSEAEGRFFPPSHPGYIDIDALAPNEADLEDPLDTFRKRFGRDPSMSEVLGDVNEELLEGFARSQPTTEAPAETMEEQFARKNAELVAARQAKYPDIMAQQQQAAPGRDTLSPGALAAAQEAWGLQPESHLPPTGPGVQQQPPESTHPRFQQYPPQVAQAPSVPPEVVQHPISSYPSGTDLEGRGIAPDEFRGRQATPAELAQQAGAYQAALTAQMDSPEAAQRRGYAVRNNRIVDPLPLSERPVTQRDQDAAQRGRDMAMNQFKAGRGDVTWSDEGYEGKEGTGPRFNWTTASEEERREYVDLQRQIGGVSGQDDLALDMPAITGGTTGISYEPPERYKQREARAKKLYEAGEILHPSLRAMNKYDRAQQREDNLALAAEPGKTTRFKKAQVRGAQRALRGANTKGEKIAALSLLPGDVLSDPVALAAFDPSGKLAGAAVEKQKMDDARAASKRVADIESRRTDIAKTTAEANAKKANAEAEKFLAEKEKIAGTDTGSIKAIEIINGPNFPNMSPRQQEQILEIGTGVKGSSVVGAAKTVFDQNEYDIEKFQFELGQLGYSDDEINVMGRHLYRPRDGKPYDQRPKWRLGMPGKGSSQRQVWKDKGAPAGSTLPPPPPPPGGSPGGILPPVAGSPGGSPPLSPGYGDTTVARVLDTPGSWVRDALGGPSPGPINPGFGDPAAGLNPDPRSIIAGNIAAIPMVGPPAALLYGMLNR